MNTCLPKEYCGRKPSTTVGDKDQYTGLYSKDGRTYAAFFEISQNTGSCSCKYFDMRPSQKKLVTAPAATDCFGARATNVWTDKVLWYDDFVDYVDKTPVPIRSEITSGQYFCLD